MFIFKFLPNKTKVALKIKIIWLLFQVLIIKFRKLFKCNKEINL